MTADRRKRAAISIAIVYPILILAFGWMNYAIHSYPTFGKSLFKSFLHTTALMAVFWIPLVTPDSRRGVIYCGIITFIIAGAAYTIEGITGAEANEWWFTVVPSVIVGVFFGVISAVLKISYIENTTSK